MKGKKNSKEGMNVHEKYELITRNLQEVIGGDELKELGVKSKVNHTTGVVEVDFDEKKVSLDKIKQVIKKEGYTIA